MEYPIESSSTGSNWISRWSVRLHRWKALLRKRWWILLLAISIGVAYQAWVLSRKPVLYQSVGEMFVSGQLKTQTGSSYYEEVNQFFGTQTKLMTSSKVLDRARDRIRREFPDLQGNASVSATLEPRTSIFILTGIGNNPLYTQEFVNAVMDEFINLRRDFRQEQTDAMMVDISEELASMRTELELREQDLDKFIEANNMAFWEQQRVTAATFLSQLKTEQSNLSKELRLLENLTADQLLIQQSSILEQPQKTANQPESTAEDSSFLQGNASRFASAGGLQQQFLSTRQELFKLQTVINEFAVNLKPAHPKMVDLQERKARMEQLLGLIRKQMQEAVESRKVAIKAELRGVETSIEEWQVKNLEARRKGSEYEKLDNRVDNARETYSKLLDTIQNLDISKNINQEVIQILNEAKSAVEMPPDVPKHLGLGLLMGFGAGFGLLLLLDRADDRITSFTEVTEQFNLPILGQIPAEVEDSESDIVPLLERADDRYMFVEAFRNLRSSLIFMPDQNEIKTLLVTSSIPGEGKSTIAANLGITMAFAGTRTLLVDADLKRGDLARMFNIDGRFGFSSILRDNTSWQSIAQSSGYDNLSIIPRGPVAGSPAELLLQHNLETFIGEVRDAYDLVIFNSAPILATDDTTTLAPSIDGTIMVVRAFVTSARLAENSLNALYQRQARITGLVLNAVNTEVSDYYHYRYSQYYTRA